MLKAVLEVETVDGAKAEAPVMKLNKAAAESFIVRFEFRVVAMVWCAMFG